MRPTTQQRRNDIDGLRAAAVVAIILYHAGFGLSRGFFIGVDMFFVISGYFIALGLRREMEGGRFSLGGFYLRRLWRIMPPLGVVALCCVVPAYFWASPQDFVRLAKTILSVLTFVSNCFFYSQGGYFDAPLESNPFLPTWFLSVQVQFYVIFPLIFWLFARRFPKRLLALVATLLVASLVLSEWSVRNEPTAAYFLLFSRLWELMLGSLAAILCRRGILRPAALPGWAAETLGWAAVIVIALCGFSYGETTPFPGAAALPVCLGTAVLVVLPHSARRPPSVSFLLGLRPVAFAGLISYSVYLWHWPIFVYVKEYQLVEMLSNRTKLLAIPCSFAVGFVSWALVERGLGNAKSLGMKARIAVIIAPVAASAVLLAVLSATAGMPNRFPPEAQPYIAALEELKKSTAEGAAVQINDMTPQSAERVRRGDLHVFGNADAARTTFLIWGDSHAYHYRPLFSKILHGLPARGLFLPTPGHPPLLGVYRRGRDTGEQQAAFMDITAAALDLIREREIPVVVLSSNWHFYAGDDLAAPEEGGGAAAGFAALRIGIDKTVAALDEAGCEIWMVRPSPSFPFMIPQMMMRTIRAGGDTGKLSLPAGEYERINAGVMEILDSVAERYPGVRFIDPAPGLCPGGTCPPAIDNRPLYLDDNHLSAFGALIPEPAFDDLVDSLRRHAE